MKKTTQILTALAVLGLCSCAQLETQKSQQVTLDEESWVTEGRGKVRKVQKGQTVAVEGEPVLVERPGHLGVLILPPSRSTEDFKLSLRPLTEFGGQYVDVYLNQYLSRLMTKVTEVQQLLSRRKTSEALTLIQALREEHPKVSYLMFLEASCHVVAGNADKAKSLLKRGLEEFPHESEAKILYRSLAGGGDR